MRISDWSSDVCSSDLLATSSQARRRASRTLLDGVHLCAAYLQQVGHPPCCVVGETARAHPEVAAIIAQCQSGATKCIVLPDALFGALSQVEQDRKSTRLNSSH